MKTQHLKVNKVNANVVAGYYLTMTDTRTNEVLFCSTINGHARSPSPQKQVDTFRKGYKG